MATSGAQEDEFNYQEALAALLKRQAKEMQEWEEEMDRTLKRQQAELEALQTRTSQPEHQRQSESRSFVPMFTSLPLTDSDEDEVIPSPSTTAKNNERRASRHMRVTSEDVVILDSELASEASASLTAKPPAFY